MNNWLRYLVNLLTLLTLIRLLDLILIQGELKPTSPALSVVLSLTSLIISCFNAGYISTLIWRNLTQTLQNSKLTSDKYKKYLKNNLYLYYGVEDHKLDFCPKKQTMVSPKG